MEHECIYGITTKGQEVTLSFLEGETYPRRSASMIGLMDDWVDRRMSCATHYNYCPICGEKLNYKIAKKIAKSRDEWTNELE